MITYEKLENENGIVIIRNNEDSSVTCIPPNLENPDYQAYLKSLEA